MSYKIFPHTLFGILMWVIAAGLLFYAIITGTLSFKDTKQQQETLIKMQIEHVILANNIQSLPKTAVPTHLKPAPPPMKKILKSMDKALTKNYQLFYDPNPPHAYWLRDASGNFILLPAEEPALLWAKYFGARLLLIFILIAISAFALSYMIKKPLAQLTAGLLHFKNNRTIISLTPSGPKELTDVFAAVTQMMSEINAFEQQRQLVLAGIAHDICTPLARIRVALEMLPNLDPQKKAALINDIEQINYLQEQFLRYTAAKQIQPLQIVDLIGLLESCVEQYPRDDIELNLPEQNILIKANPRQLYRAFDNILANALQHGAPPVHISMQIHAQTVLISITDHGPGVPEALLSKITQPLYRTDTARSNCLGTGLGLAITVEVIQALNGSIVLSNVQAGGLQVQISLPYTAHAF